MDILAAVTLDDQMITGGVPVFIVNTPEEQNEIAEDLRYILRADVFRLRNGIMLLIPIRQDV